MPSARKKIRYGTTADMMVALGKRYGSGRGNGRAYAMLSNVAEGTGHAGTSGYADAIAVSLWPSRGLEIIGHELKASRSDWLREYKRPEKNSGFIPFCHRWYLVVSGEGIVQPGELPAAWGLLQLKGGALREITAAPRQEPTPLSLEFFCALIRRVADGMVTVEDREAYGEERYNHGFAAGKASLVAPVGGEAATYREAYDKMIKYIHEFEKASGLDFSASLADAAKIGALAKILRDGREYRSWVDHATKRRQAAVEEAEQYAELIKKFDDLKATLPDAPYPHWNGPSFEELIGAPKADKNGEQE